MFHVKTQYWRLYKMYSIGRNDCVSYVLAKLEIKLDYKNVSQNEISTGILVRNIVSNFRTLPRLRSIIINARQLSKGDIILASKPSTRYASHIGIYKGKGIVDHCIPNKIAGLDRFKTRTFRLGLRLEL